MTDTEREALTQRIDELCQENERLRELADGAMNEADRLTHDAAALQIENAKLRELVHGLNHCTTWANEDGKDCLSCPLWHEKNCTAEDIERELGIEVTA